MPVPALLRDAAGWSWRLLLVAGVAYGVLLLLASLSTSLVVALPMLCLAGGAGVGFVSTANARVQLVCAPAVRGRIMAIYALIFVGSTPVGAPLIGWVGQHVGPRAALGGGGVLAALATLVLVPAALADRRAAALDLVPAEVVVEPSAA
jgi:predicted MFS family arabinose efflux permease